MSQKYSYQTNQQKYNFILKVYNRIMFLLHIFFSPKYTMKTLCCTNIQQIIFMFFPPCIYARESYFLVSYIVANHALNPCWL